jgi:hypothetical protein
MISDALRSLWSSAEDDPVPTEFLDLLDQLDARRAPARMPTEADIGASADHGAASSSARDRPGQGSSGKPEA